MENKAPQNISLKLEGENVTFRTGSALPLKEPHVINFTGDLQSVSRYLQKHGKANPDVYPNWVDPKAAIIIVNRKDMSICLRTDSNDPYAHIITGALTLSDELKKFNINATATMSREQFVKLLRFSKMYFDNVESYDKVLSAYQAFKVTQNQDLQASSDNRANKNYSFNKQVNSELPETFMLTIPVFNGYPAVKIQVEICFDVSENRAEFWLESPELAELVITRRDELIAEELKEIEQQYVVLYQ